MRFGATLIGSKAMAGAFDPAWLDKADDARHHDAPGARRLRRRSRRAGAALDRRGKNVVAYVESHIEQGPVLLNEGLAVGVVTAIAGATRIGVARHGLAGHAGTVPMGARRDALAAAAKWCWSSSDIASAHAGLVGTVGKHRRRCPARST